MHLFAGQDLLPQHSNPNGAELNSSIRLASPLNSQPSSATLTITNDQLLPQSPANTGMAGKEWHADVCLYLVVGKSLIHIQNYISYFIQYIQQVFHS